MARKTFDVEKLKERVNFFLLNSRDDQRDMRRGQMAMLEGVLHDTGNYRGFNYLNPRDMKGSEYGHTVGVNHYGDTEELRIMQEAGTLFLGTDNSRVFYY